MMDKAPHEKDGRIGMNDYARIKIRYALGRPDAHLLLEQELCEAAGHFTDDRALGRIARHLAAAVAAGKTDRWEAFRKVIEG